ncbi:MAG: hypothetical protein RIF36_09490 [Imperialibacter sp.]|uniref:hypothetical protein n=1 Tax=Imperialibacter sp. TaxID=2038411 RepID=UPI0032EAB400
MVFKEESSAKNGRWGFGVMVLRFGAKGWHPSHGYSTPSGPLQGFYLSIRRSATSLVLDDMMTTPQKFEKE